MQPLPSSVQPHLQAHAAAMRDFREGLEQAATLRQLARYLFSAAAALVEAGKALVAAHISTHHEDRHG